jgi:2-polyprenyl-6-methoxyphenol hydroxylase-like FAD-dependent oxidoreductase
MRVLVVDRARFPSDTLSTHQVQVPGAARLRKLGALDRLLAAGTPPTRHLTFDQGRSCFRAPMPSVDGLDVMVSPRRTRLDATLGELARESGAEVREGFAVEEVCVDRGRVTGIRGAARGGGARVSEQATVVVGADGKHSFVARAVEAPEYDRLAPRSMAAYTYWSGLPTDGGEIHTRPGHATALWPTDDGCTLCFLAQPAASFGAFHADMEGGFLRAMQGVGLGDRLHAGERAERLRATTDLPAVKRRPHGPGWALVGDAGLTMDPITGQGISFALRDADLLADALVSGLGGEVYR